MLLKSCKNFTKLINHVFQLRLANGKKMQILSKNIQTAQAKQKRNYDQKHNVAECFGVGSTVLLKDFNRKKHKGGKLDFRWQGPFVIVSSLGRGLFKLKDLNGTKASVSKMFQFYFL